MVSSLLLLLLFGAYQFGANKFSKEKQVNVMIEAFQNKDVSAIDEFVKVDDPGLKVKPEDIKAYIRYLKDNPSYNKDIIVLFTKRGSR